MQPNLEKVLKRNHMIQIQMTKETTHLYAVNVVQVDQESVVMYRLIQCVVAE